MKVLAALRALALAYQAEEPEEFRVAEQFGIQEMPALLLRRPRSVWRAEMGLRDTSC